MAGRFGKYGDIKRKALIRKKRVKPGDFQSPGKNKPRKGPQRRKY